MADHSAMMTLARFAIVQLRLQGLMLAALVERGVLQATETAALVDDAAAFLPKATNDPAIEGQLAEALTQLSADLKQSRPR